MLKIPLGSYLAPQPIGFAGIAIAASDWTDRQHAGDITNPAQELLVVVVSGVGDAGLLHQGEIVVPGQL